MRRKLAIGRIVGCVIGITAIGLAIHWGLEAKRSNREFHEWFSARPMETTIDFSQPGTVSVPFHQTCSISHGQGFYLHCDANDTSPPEPNQLLKGLSGTVAIESQQGQPVAKLKLQSQNLEVRDGDILLTQCVPFENGDYRATIHIESGAPALAGKRQLIFARYHLCGLEQFPALIAGGFSVGAAMIGMIAVIWITPALLTEGIWRRECYSQNSDGASV